MSPVGKSKYVRVNLGDCFNCDGFARGHSVSTQGFQTHARLSSGLHAGFPASLQSETLSF